LYVIEVNPRASRTVPYISKVTGVKMCDAATRVCFKETLADLGYGTGLFRPSPYVAVKVPIFSFEKLADLDTQLGPEMKSTGEVLGLGRTLEEALCKGLIAAGYKMVKKGGVFISVRDGDKSEIAAIAKKYDSLGFKLYATRGTGTVLTDAGLKVNVIGKLHENTSNLIQLMESGKIQYLISTSAKGRNPARDSVKMRRKAIQFGVPCLTAIDTANALADSLKSKFGELNTELININELRHAKQKLSFVKMQGTGNDFVCMDVRKEGINSPESLAVQLSDRHFGIGADAIVLIGASGVADIKVNMYNPDGSESKNCGNGLRCVAKYLYDDGVITKKSLRAETLDGIKNVTVTTKNNCVLEATVEMGRVELATERIPVLSSEKELINKKITVDGEELTVTVLAIGDPHVVLFYDEIDGVDLKTLGEKLEFNKLFPTRVNTDIAQVSDKNTVRVRVWESGCGETLGCGTGACAAAAAAVLNGKCDGNADIKVILPGGELTVRYDGENVVLTGKAQRVFEGVVEL
jgi:carbamoyl-phosphate synthase large subunit